MDTLTNTRARRLSVAPGITDQRKAVIQRIARSQSARNLLKNGKVDWSLAREENPNLAGELKLGANGMGPIYGLSATLFRKGQLLGSPDTDAGAETGGGAMGKTTLTAIRFCPECGVDVYQKCSSCGTNLVRYLMAANFKDTANAQ